MAFATTPAVIHDGDWTIESRQHPALKLLEDWATALDNDRQAFSEKLSKWYTTDYSWQRPDGTKYKGQAESWQYWSKTFGPTMKMYHQPEHIIVTEASEGRKGYDITAVETLFVSFAKPPSEDELAGLPKDRKGDTYDWAYRVLVRYEMEEEEDGQLKIKSELDCSDVFPSLQAVVKRGMMPAQSLLAGHSDLSKRGMEKYE